MLVLGALILIAATLVLLRNDRIFGADMSKTGTITAPSPSEGQASRGR